MRRHLAGLVLLVVTVAVQAKPKRIISTLPSATETLFALGQGEDVVAVSNYCRYPPAVLSLPKIGTYMKPDPERIALLQPDLVIVEKAASSIQDKLSALQIPYTPVKVDSLPDIYTMIQEIGRVTGVPEKAQVLEKQIHSRLDTIRSEGSGHAKPTVLMVVGRTPGLLTNLIAVGPSTYLGALLQIAGGENAVSATSIPYPHISLESVVRFDPDVILDLSMMGEATDPRVQDERLRRPWLSRRELKAVSEGNVYGLSSETLVTPGPRVAEAAMEIRTKIRIWASQKVER